MRVFIIRHAIAEERAPGVVDDERRLTKRGQKRFRGAARGLARLYAPPSVMISSPLVRARQTARIASQAWDGLEVALDDALAGGSVEDVVKLLARFPADASVALVGHEPQLSELLAHLVESNDASRLAFKKGGVGVVDLPGGPASAGTLAAFLPPGVLRAVR
ncbi:MAG: phosphohistidine phosphatase SixA [Vicinamibacteria bacterium]